MITKSQVKNKFCKASSMCNIKFYIVMYRKISHYEILEDKTIKIEIPTLK